MICPECKHEVAATTWVCPHCDHILDPSAIDGGGWPADATQELPAVSATDFARPEKTSVVWASSIGAKEEPPAEALILGDVTVDAEDFQVLPGAGASRDGKTSTFLFYTSGATSRILRPDGVPVVLDSAAASKLPRTPYEDFILSCIDGKLTVREIQRASGLAPQEVVITLLTLVDKKFVTIEPPAGAKAEAKKEEPKDRLAGPDTTIAVDAEARASSIPTGPVGGPEPQQETHDLPPPLPRKASKREQDDEDRLPPVMPSDLSAEDEEQVTEFAGTPAISKIDAPKPPIVAPSRLSEQGKLPVAPPARPEIVAPSRLREESRRESLRPSTPPAPPAGRSSPDERAPVRLPSFEGDIPSVRARRPERGSSGKNRKEARSEPASVGPPQANRKEARSEPASVGPPQAKADPVIPSVRARHDQKPSTPPPPLVTQLPKSGPSIQAPSSRIKPEESVRLDVRPPVRDPSAAVEEKSFGARTGGSLAALEERSRPKRARSSEGRRKSKARGKSRAPSSVARPEERALPPPPRAPERPKLVDDDLPPLSLGEMPVAKAPSSPRADSKDAGRSLDAVTAAVAEAVADVVADAPARKEPEKRHGPRITGLDVPDTGLSLPGDDSMDLEDALESISRSSLPSLADEVTPPPPPPVAKQTPKGATPPPVLDASFLQEVPPSVVLPAPQLPPRAQRPAPPPELKEARGRLPEVARSLPPPAKAPPAAKKSDDKRAAPAAIIKRPVQEKSRSEDAGPRGRPKIGNGAGVQGGADVSGVDGVRMAKAQKLFEAAIRDKAEGNLVSARMNMKLALTFDPTNPLYLQAYEDLTPKSSDKPSGSPARAREFYDAATEAERDGRVQEAINLLERALAEAKEPAFYNRLGVILAMKRHEFARAQQLIQTAIALAPGNPTYEHNLGKVLQMAAKHDVEKREEKPKAKGGILGFLGRKK